MSSLKKVSCGHEKHFEVGNSEIVLRPLDLNNSFMPWKGFIFHFGLRQQMKVFTVDLSRMTYS